MRWVAALFGAAGALATLVRPAGQAKEQILITGDMAGYLSPCGCTYPMTGGLLRQVSMVKALEARMPTTMVDTGNIVGGMKRQDVLKAETIAQALPVMDVAAVNVTMADASMGAGELLSLTNLSRGRFVSASLRASGSNECPQSVVRSGYLIFGASTRPDLLAARLGESAVSLDTAIEDSLRQAVEQGLRPILLLDGDRDSAQALASRFPKLFLIVYRSMGRPPLHLETAGQTYLASPGNRGQHIVSLVLEEGRGPEYRVYDLGPDVKDDPDAARFYAYYLRRVVEEGLWEMKPRLAGKPFSGSERCGKCHREALTVWRASKHHGALHTLQTHGHGADPECLPCHVTGSEFRTGYATPSTTPQLASVGCESCHGAGEAHSLKPRAVRMAKLGEKSCLPCHSPLNSPLFDFRTYWKRVKHGL